MDKIKTVKIKNEDGSVSKEAYYISADARNIDMTNGYNVQDTIGTIDVNDNGSIAEQLNFLKENANSVNIDIKKKVFYYDTVANMKIDESLKVGDMAITLGYYSPNDGGGAEYRIISGTYAEEYGNYIRLGNNLFAELLIKDRKINVKQLGLEDTSRSQDCSDKMQKILDYCHSNNITAFFPGGYTFTIAHPIIMRELAGSVPYIIEGGNVVNNIPHILINCDYGFVGENFPNAITYIYMRMKHMSIRCSQTMRVTIFKGIVFRASKIEESYFYYPYIFLEGSMQWGCYFQNNRVQNFYFCVFSALIFKNEQNFDFEAIRTTLTTNHGDLTSVSNYILPSLFQLNDSVFCENNYFAGHPSYAEEQGGTCIFLIDNVDWDFYIHKNWMEFCMYVFRPHCLGITTQDPYHFGCTVFDNEFQYFYRFFEPGARYTNWIINNNQFVGFKAEDLANKNMGGSNIYNNNECGILIAKSSTLDNITTYLQNIEFIDNKISDCNMVIDIDIGTGSGNQLNIYEKNTGVGFYTGGSATAVMDKIHIAYYKSAGSVAFEKVYIGAYDRKVWNTLPPIKNSNNRYENVFIGQIAIVDGEIYMLSRNSTDVFWKQISNVST